MALIARTKSSKGQLVPKYTAIPCDACGYSKISAVDDKRLHIHSAPLYRSSGNNHLADARYEIIISVDPEIMVIYLCAHHFNKHMPYITVEGFEVIELVKPAV